MLIPRLLMLGTLATAAAAQPTNIARFGTATQSATSSGGVASRAIDGNIDGHFPNGSVTHTASALASWWEVTFQPAVVHEIWLYNRSDCCGARLANFRVSLFVGASPVFQRVFPNPVPQGRALKVELVGIPGDRVRVELLGMGVLSLAEVEVLNHKLPSLNLALLGTASQSTVASGGVPDRAIDGNRDGYYPNGSVTHTANQPGGWWEVALAWLERIDQIRIYNRSNCCAGRLSNFRVSVFNGMTETFGRDYFATSGNVGAGRALVVDLPSGTEGDRIRVALLGPGRTNETILSVAEVEAWRYGASLTPDVLEIKSQVGNKQTLAVDGGRSQRRQLYFLMGTLSGTRPGLKVGTVTIPLNNDTYFRVTISNPNRPPLMQSVGALDPFGRGEAIFAIPQGAPSLVGLRFDHAYVVLGANPLIAAVSNPAALRIVQ